MTREEQLRAAWEMGITLARSYGDNVHHLDGEQKERQWATALDALRADPSVSEGTPYGAEVLCGDCARVFCPHGERLHFAHDGCPACCETSTAARESLKLSE